MNAASPWSLDVLTLFPSWFAWMEECRPLRNARESGQLELRVVDMRSASPLKHSQVDDMPYGGGPGMVLRVDIVVAALEELYGLPLSEIRERRRIVLLTPAGRQFDSSVAHAWTAERRPTTLLCGRYEGFDHRVHEQVATEEVSIGPYVLSGGEPAAMAIVDTVSRLLPGALGNAGSLEQETFSDGLEGGLEYPHYTRPEEFRGWSVPAVLLSGNHAEIVRWRSEQASLRTQAARDTASS